MSTHLSDRRLIFCFLFYLNDISTVTSQKQQNFISIVHLQTIEKDKVLYINRDINAISKSSKHNWICIFNDVRLKVYILREETLESCLTNLHI